MWWVATAFAVDPGLSSCCAAVGATACPDTLTAVGPASSQAAAQGATAIQGLWTLECGAAPRWDGAATAMMSKAYPVGTVLTPMLPRAAACFEVTCTLPSGACVNSDGKRTWIAACDGTELTDAAWRASPRPGHPAVVVGGRVLGATVQQGDAAPMPGPSPAPSAAIGVDPKVPAAPPERCNTAPALREPSNQQVDAGNEAVVQGNLREAADRYRAAISINPCNAFAWAALGEVLSNASFPAPATTSLSAATRLMPTNFHAWTVLGKVKEQQGDLAGAVLAYQRALAAKPAHPPAAEALARLGN